MFLNNPRCKKILTVFSVYIYKKRENKQIERGKSSRHQKRLVTPALFLSSPTYKYPPPGTQTPHTAKAPSKTARLIQHPSPSPRSVHLLHIRLSSQRRPPPFSSSHRSSVIVGCRSRPLVTSEHDEARRGARGRRGGAAFLVPAAEDGDGGGRQRLVQEAGRAGRPRPRRRGILARLHEGLVAQAQAYGAPAWRRRRGARRLDGAAPIGIGPVRDVGGGGQGEAGGGVPGLRWHVVPDRGGPRPRRPDGRDEGRGARRGGALPDSDRQWAVLGQGVQLRAAGGALLRREPRDGHPRAHRRPQPPRQGGVVGAVPAGERVPAGDGGGVRGAGVAGGAVHPGRQGGEQQVLPVGALPVRGGARLGSALRAGPRRAQGLPGPAPHAGPQGAGGPPHDPLGQGQGARVPAQRPRLRRRRQRRRLPHLRRRRPHRRGRLPGAARARAGRRDPRVQVPQGDQRVLHAPGPRRGQGVPAQARRRQRQHHQLILSCVCDLIPFPP